MSQRKLRYIKKLKLSCTKKYLKYLTLDRRALQRAPRGRKQKINNMPVKHGRDNCADKIEALLVRTLRLRSSRTDTQQGNKENFTRYNQYYSYSIPILHTGWNIRNSDRGKCYHESFQKLLLPLRFVRGEWTCWSKAWRCEWLSWQPWIWSRPLPRTWLFYTHFPECKRCHPDISQFLPQLVNVYTDCRILIDSTFALKQRSMQTSW